MPYKDLTREQYVQFAETVPDRPQVTALHDYVANVRMLVNGQDAINIPESHKKLLRGENHEGSIALNRRIRQLASWFSAADVRFQVHASGPGEDVQRGTTRMERFAFRGEKELARGSGLHRWKQESHRDLAEVGVAITQQNARRGYYIGVDAPRMAEGSLLRDVIWRRRVDPATFGWVEDVEGDLGLTTIKASRPLGEIAKATSLEAAVRTMGYFDFGEALDPNDSDSWDPSHTIETTEIWGSNCGALVVVGGSGQKGTSYEKAGPDRVIAEWKHTNGHPPFYIAAPSTWPWHSPLDEMVQLTNVRNYWATMIDLQASAAIFRHWQLVDANTGQDLTYTTRDAVPEHLRYDLSKPPPDMGPGTRWELAPFEFQDVAASYDRIRIEHERAGTSVARLMGQDINGNTAVGTADAMDSASAEEFAEWIECLQYSKQELWSDTFRYIRDAHKDPVLVSDQKRDMEGPKVGAFINIQLAVAAEDIVSDVVEVRLDTRNRLQKVADFRLAVEAISSGMMDYDRAVNSGLIPDVDDPESEKLAIFISEAERIEAQVELKALQMRAAQAAGLMPGAEESAGSPRFLEGKRTDPRGTGAGQGADNVSNSALATGASDTLRAG